jgi:hypothetical protein
MIGAVPGRFAVAAAGAAAVLLVAAVCPASNCAGTSTGLVPLTQLGSGLYLGQFQGGLYPGGSNAIPQAHLTAGLAAAAAVVPRNTLGAPDPQNGQVVLLSLGMSNTTLEFCIGGQGTTGCTPESFMGQAAADPAVNHATLTIVNGARGGQDAGHWLDPAGANYAYIATLLGGLGLSEAQVQVVWVKQADGTPTTSLPSGSADAYGLETRLGMIARALRTRYPNVRQVFFSSRIYAGYASTNLNPEPWAYEGGFAVKWLVEAQITQMATPGTPADPVAGDLDYGGVAPWVAWGPYLWADGTTPRSDGLTYVCADLNTDGTHPATGAVQKVGALLLDFFLTSPVTRSWFAAGGASATTTTTTTSGSTTTTTAPVPVCAPQPRPGCQGAASGRAELLLADSTPDDHDRLRWRWVGSAAVAKAAFGSPASVTGYALCLYDRGALRLQGSAPAAGACAAKPCWKELRRGFRYADNVLTPDGVQKVSLTAGQTAKLVVKGRGARLDMPRLPLGSPVRVQLQRNDGAACWESTFSGTPIRNDAGRFKARSD